eukprot:9044799-Pyramimonas_sp.AAC.1
MTAGNSAIVAVMTAVQGMGPESTYVADGAILSIVANEAWSQVVDILPENLADVFDTVYRLNNDAKFMACVAVQTYYRTGKQRGPNDSPLVPPPGALTGPCCQGRVVRPPVLVCLVKESRL